MKTKRKRGHGPQTHVEWTNHELDWLRKNAKLYAFQKDLIPFLPRHTFMAIQHKCQQLGLVGDWRVGQWHHGKPTWTPLLYWELQKGPVTAVELMQRVGCKRSTVNFNLRQFKLAGVAYICHWIRRPGSANWIPVWSSGEGGSVRRPKAQGLRREHAKPLVPYAGNPFAHLLEQQHVDPQHTQDVCP